MLHFTIIAARSPSVGDDDEVIVTMSFTLSSIASSSPTPDFRRTPGKHHGDDDKDRRHSSILVPRCLARYRCFLPSAGLRGKMPVEVAASILRQNRYRHEYTASRAAIGIVPILSGQHERINIILLVGDMIAARRATMMILAQAEREQRAWRCHGSPQRNMPALVLVVVSRAYIADDEHKV